MLQAIQRFFQARIASIARGEGSEECPRHLDTMSSGAAANARNPSGRSARFPRHVPLRPSPVTSPSTREPRLREVDSAFTRPFDRCYGFEPTTG